MWKDSAKRRHVNHVARSKVAITIDALFKSLVNKMVIEISQAKLYCCRNIYNK